MDEHTLFNNIDDKNPFGILLLVLGEHYELMKPFHELDKVTSETPGVINERELIIATLKAFYSYLRGLDYLLKKEFRIIERDIKILEKFYVLDPEDPRSLYKFKDRFRDSIFLGYFEKRFDTFKEVFNFLEGAAESIQANLNTDLFTAVLHQHHIRIIKTIMEIIEDLNE